jgi:hypothetical protein
MFEELLGLPAHPLLVHAAVVFGPLLVASVFGYALVPPLRKYLGWVVVLLSVTAPFALWFAKLSGEALERKRIRDGAPAKTLAEINNHQHFGNLTLWWGIALGVLGIVLVLAVTAAGKKPTTTSSRVVTWGLIVLSLVTAAILGYYVFKTGDSGARMVWT